MARPPATEEQRQAQRHRIYLAAREIYEETGIDSISIRGVAARACVSQGTIYSYFANRSELMRSLWLEPVTKVGRQLEQLAAATPDPVERIRSLLLAFIDFAVGNPDVHRGAMLFVRPASRDQPDVSPPEELAFYRLMLEAVTELTESGGLALQEPALAVELLWAAVHGALGLAINTDIYDLSPADVLAPKMVDLLMRSVVTAPSDG